MPIATSLWPESSGATSGRSASRSVERSTSMYATTSRVARQPGRSAGRGRGPSGRGGARARRPARRPAGRRSRHVPSVLALSAIVIRHENGNRRPGSPCSRRTVTAQRPFLVVDRDHDLHVEHRRPRRSGRRIFHDGLHAQSFERQRRNGVSRREESSKHAGHEVVPVARRPGVTTPRRHRSRASNDAPLSGSEQAATRRPPRM